MSRDASITLDWADGSYTFRLAWGELIKLQEACDAGPGFILLRLAGPEWRLEDIASTIRLGLIGGGLEPAKALKLVRDYVESRPPLENRMLARGILSLAIHGPADEQPGEAPAAPETESAKNHCRAGKSVSQNSMAPAPRSASPRNRSMPARSGSSPQP